MHIAIDARMYGPKAATGIGVYVKTLIEQFGNMNTDDRWSILLSPEHVTDFVPPNSRFTAVAAPAHWYTAKEQIVIPKILRSLQPDVVHIPHFNAPLLWRGPLVVTIHDVTPHFFPGPNVRSSFVRRVGYEAVFRSGLRRAQRIITISEHTKQQLENIFHIDTKKVRVTHLGVDPLFAQPVSPEKIADLRSQHQITKPFLFYIGVWRDHKNLPGLIAAFTEVRKAGHDVQLVLAGAPDDRYPEVMRAIEGCPFRQDIICPGFIPQVDLSAWYQAAAVFVLPSFCEGFGLVALEAAVGGTPVVGSTTTSVPEVLGDLGVYASPHHSAEIAAAIIECLDNPNRRTQLLAARQELLKKYSWSACAQATHSVYAECHSVV
jgi:glycosyltransferase involved in cell wall biosynthesis